MTTYSRKRIVATMLAVLASVCVLSSAWSAEYRSVKREGTNVRSGPGTDRDVLFELPAGYPLKVLKRDGSWLNVEDFEGDQGWIMESVTNANATVILKAANANLRSGPSTKDSVVGTAKKGTILTKLNQKGEWIKISHPGLGEAAWVSQSLVWP